MRSQNEERYAEDREAFLKSLGKAAKGLSTSIIDNFAKYASRQKISRFLARHELFGMTREIKGSIVECGVYEGGGLMTWAQLSAIYEPFNYHREIIGFDTFAGFPGITKKDRSPGGNKNAVAGALYCNSYNELMRCVELYDQNRPVSHVPKVRLIKGDFLKTGCKFLANNQHLVISLLYLDFDIYAPTRKALQLFVPRMPRGSIIAFDEINNPDWPGETIALLETMNINHHEIRQFHYEPNISYLII